jgi:hypothetical protein
MHIVLNCYRNDKSWPSMKELSFLYILFFLSDSDLELLGTRRYTRICTLLQVPLVEPHSHLACHLSPNLMESISQADHI